ncbi:hypothetical protein SBA3_2050006 [Candidatus Sulfopaludibacter sp. SbA3]|nr:hypothetical protein SBA3_2050006 [Candidatus Sulfopaludibacter sp. SbA3]
MVEQTSGHSLILNVIGADEVAFRQMLQPREQFFPDSFSPCRGDPR